MSGQDSPKPEGGDSLAVWDGKIWWVKPRWGIDKEWMPFKQEIVKRPKDPSHPDQGKAKQA